jgi:SLT domain-containing protein
MRKKLQREQKVLQKAASHTNSAGIKYIKHQYKRRSGRWRVVAREHSRLEEVELPLLVESGVRHV